MAVLTDTAEIIKALKANTAEDLPVLFADAGLPALDVFAVGHSRNEKDKGLFFYLDSYSESGNMITVSPIVQAQLAGFTFENALKAHDVIIDFFNSFRIDDFILEGVNTDIWPIEQSQGVFIFFSLTYTQILDSCNWRRA